METNEYKLTILRQLLFLWPGLIFLLLVPAISLYFLIIDPSKVYPISSLIIMTVFGFFYIPVFIIHLNYYKYDKKKKDLKKSRNSLTFNQNGQTVKIELENIEEIIVHQVNNRGSWFLYYYSELKLKNGEKIIITCLLMSESELRSIFEIKTKVKSEFFPIIKKEKRQHITASHIT